MGKSEKDSAPARQGVLFEGGAGETGSCDDDASVRALVTEVIRRSPKSREQLAEEMTVLLARPVTARMLYAWTAYSSEVHRFPLAYARAFCQASGDYRLIALLVERLGLAVIDGDQARLLELAERLLAKEISERDFTTLKDSLMKERRARHD